MFEVAFLYARPGFGVLGQVRIEFDPQSLLDKGWDFLEKVEQVRNLYENASFASRIGLCDSLALINVAGVLGGVSNGGQQPSDLALACFYNATRDLLTVPYTGWNPLPELP